MAQTPRCLRLCLFPRETPQGNHLSNSETLIFCEIYMQREVMKRCICAVAFPLPSADLQYKVKCPPWCQSFDRDRWSRCGCNKIKVLRVDISVTAQESHQASSQKHTMKKRLGRCRLCLVFILLFYALSTDKQHAAGSYGWGGRLHMCSQATLITDVALHLLYPESKQVLFSCCPETQVTFWKSVSLFFNVGQNLQR